MTPKEDRRLRLIRGYLLNTISAAERSEVDSHLTNSSEWQEEMERQRHALAILDTLPSRTPPPGLVAATLAAAREIDGTESLKRAARREQWGTVLVAFCVVATLGFLFLPALGRAREASRRASDQNNLKQLGITLKMYANDSPDEKYPPMAPYNDVWMFDLRTVYPEYLTDLAVLVNPARPDAEELVEQLYALASKEPRDWEEMTRIAAQSYTYVGWGILDASELALLGAARKAANPQQLDDRIELDGKYYYRLKEGIERFFITDINGPAGAMDYLQASIPVMFNCTTNAEGGNVLYLDGHVSFEDNLPNISLLVK